MNERAGRLSGLRDWRRRNWRWLRFPVFGGGGLFVLGVLVFAWLWVTVDLPADPPKLSSSVVVDANGHQLAVLSREGQRYQVPLDKVNPIVVKALVASEDRRFYSHSGIDPVGLLRAAWHDARNDTVQGGSTLTQQLVKNSFLSSERTVSRKAKEAVLAMKLERTMSKDEILERYLNTVYFGRGAYGIEAAARVFFGTSAEKLDLPQSALLVGLLRSPELADPTTHADVAKQRRASVLAAMVTNHAITRSDQQKAAATELGAVARDQALTPTAKIAPHFVEWVREQAVKLVGEGRVLGGGLRIVTTLDLEDQRAAEESIATTLDKPDDPQAALVALDHDGGIKAFVGSRDYRTLKLDMARGKQGGGSGRQPGSTFKPFVLTAALEKGITLGDRFQGPPKVHLDVNGQPWDVENYGLEGHGLQTVAEATASSTNTVYAQLLARVGPAAVADAAHRAGIHSRLAEHPSIALGAEEVSPLEMAEAYLTFAREGSHVTPYAIRRIEVNGTKIWAPNRGTSERSIDTDVARGVTYALRGVVAHGTGTAARLDRPVAGKTGTTQENVDAWFAGYTPNYTTVVWMGYPQGSKPMDDVHGRSVTGGSFPAQMWHSFMVRALEDVPVEDFHAPPDSLVNKRASDASVSTSSSSSSSSSSTSTTRRNGSTSSSSSTSSTSPGDTTTTGPPDTTTTVASPSTTTAATTPS